MKEKITVTPDKKILVNPEEAAALLDISRTTIYAFCKDTESGFPVVCLGNKYKIIREDLVEWFREKKGETI